MKVGHVRDLLGTQVNNPQVSGVVKKVLISPREGWDGYVMRLFELDSHGYTARHEHPWPHINFVVSGSGKLHIEGQDYALEAGSYAYVPGGKLHQFSNTGEDKLVFICIVPEEGDV